MGEIFERKPKACEVWGSQDGDFEDYCILRYGTSKSGRSLPVFWENLLPLSSAPRMEQRVTPKRC
jgi:hypothetical protein